MKLLAFDTSTRWLTVGCGDGTSFVARAEDVGNRHSERLLPLIHTLLAEAGFTLRTLDGIAFGAGPGAFTGVRIACGVAQDLGRFKHLHHERRLVSQCEIAGTDAGEEPVAQTDTCFTCGNVTAHLEQHLCERRLTHERALARHVGAGDEQHMTVPAAHVHIVGHERFGTGKRREHWVHALRE